MNLVIKMVLAMWAVEVGANLIGLKNHKQLNLEGKEKAEKELAEYKEQVRIQDELNSVPKKWSNF